ncbi:hypothetical protein CRG98_021360 [Punica granatum]|uniref:Uncharacterized protein n=1 Tax=Punica granatum TaxID=22663 RepID=A0A2I0JPQ0_PUNGR|nr:hypothetical protein CRG98_021360 [Punica granatum]
MCKAYATWLGSVHLPGDARQTRMKRSRHLLFMTRRSRAVESLGSRGTRPYLECDGDSRLDLILHSSCMRTLHSTPRNDSEATKETILDPGGVKEHLAIFQRTRPRGLFDSPWIVGGLLRRFEPFLACITRQACQ